MISNSTKRKIKRFIPRSIYEAFITFKYSRLPKIPNNEIFTLHIEDKHGIEIGGPSLLFKTTLPLYQKIRGLDGVNFTDSTVWEGKIKSGLTFNFIGNRRGMQFLSDGTELSTIHDASYDFVLSSNCLEHIANPLKALAEWKRILKTQGALILALPNKKSNFDHNRPVTPFDHLVDDFNNDMTEDDLTHLDEILKLHDLSLDHSAGDINSFKARSLDNFRNRTLHHHVFDLNSMRAMFYFLEMTVIQECESKNDFLMIAIKKS